MAGENKCKACGQWAGKGHACPTPSVTAVLDRPDAPSSASAAIEVDRDAVNDRVAAAQLAIRQAQAKDAAVSRDVAAMAATGDLYDLNPEEGSLGWLDYNDTWRGQWDDRRVDAMLEGRVFDGQDHYEDALRDELTKARNALQAAVYEDSGVAVSNEDASRITLEAAEEVGAVRILIDQKSLRSTSQFQHRLAVLMDERAPVAASRPSPFGVDLPEPQRPLHAVPLEERQRLMARMREASNSGVPGDFTPDEIATARAMLLPTPQESALKLHEAVGKSKRLRAAYEAATTDEEREDLDLEHYKAGMDARRAWDDLAGTEVGAELARELNMDPYRMGWVEDRQVARVSARRMFTRATGIAVDPSWEDGYNAQPPNLPYANGCDCRRFKWTARCEHTDVDLARQAAISAAARQVFEGSDFGKAAKKAGLAGGAGGKKQGFFKRLFG